MLDIHPDSMNMKPMLNLGCALFLQREVNMFFMNKCDSSNSVIVFIDLSSLSISCCSPKYETFLKHILSVFTTFFFF